VFKYIRLAETDEHDDKKLNINRRADNVERNTRNVNYLRLTFLERTVGAIFDWLIRWKPFLRFVQMSIKRDYASMFTIVFRTIFNHNIYIILRTV